jgi:hypothetical protein
MDVLGVPLLLPTMGNAMRRLLPKTVALSHKRTGTTLIPDLDYWDREAFEAKISGSSWPSPRWISEIQMIENPAGQEEHMHEYESKHDSLSAG